MKVASRRSNICSDGNGVFIAILAAVCAVVFLWICFWNAEL